MEAALELFVRDRFSGTTIDGIAAKAGVARQTIYNHFTRKEEVFKALSRSFADRITGPLAIEAQASDLRSALIELAIRTRSLLLAPSSLALHRLLVSEAPRFPDLARAVYKAGPQRSTLQLARYLRSASIRPLSQEQSVRAAEQFFDMILGRSQLRALLEVPQPSGSPRRLAGKAVDAFLRAWQFL